MTAVAAPGELYAELLAMGSALPANCQPVQQQQPIGDAQTESGACPLAGLSLGVQLASHTFVEASQATCSACCRLAAAWGSSVGRAAAFVIIKKGGPLPPCVLTERTLPLHSRLP